MTNFLKMFVNLIAPYQLWVKLVYAFVFIQINCFDSMLPRKAFDENPH